MPRIQSRRHLLASAFQDPVKSLDEEQADSEEPHKGSNQDTDDPTLEDAEGEEADEGVGDAQSDDDKAEAHERTKRKLDEDDTGDGGEGGRGDAGDKVAGGDEENDADETSEGDRPRKKSKVDEDA